ncbi:MAG TPA: SemiSWEET family transporter [Kofleriaceae bacterium]
MPGASTFIGYAACVASITAFIPQLWKVVSTRDTKSLSTPMWIFEVVTFVLWSVYGVYLHQIPIIVTNIVCGLMSTIILGMKLLAIVRST